MIDSTLAPVSDHDLWHLVRQGEMTAFAALVQRYQSLICSVAYGACGDLATSEDVAQETFWAAWQQRETLQDADRLRSWLCGIARNLGNNARRKSGRQQSQLSLEVAEEARSGADPAELAVSQEEESLLWQTLERLPQSYREPLILYYREEQSVANVAVALDLTEATVKQRLCRGRDLLRDRLADIVAGSLIRSRPGKAFTASVLAGLSALSLGAKASPMVPVAAVATAGVAGGLFGAVIGIAGGWLGGYLGAHSAATKEQRDDLLRVNVRLALGSVVFTLLLLGGIWLFAGSKSPLGYVIFLLSLMCGLWAYIGTEFFLFYRRDRLRKTPGTPNDSPWRQSLTQVSSRLRGRVWRSESTLLGLPLIDINVSDPMPNEATPRIARGWIAIGDRAEGILLGFGGIARGLIAIGGVACGGIAIGGLSFGLLAIGGLALGWIALAGLALGWQMACGGGAIAWHEAFGGFALAQDFAIGGYGVAANANNPAAQEALQGNTLASGYFWLIQNPAVFIAGNIVIVVVLILLMRLLYKREKPASNP